MPGTRERHFALCDQVPVVIYIIVNLCEKLDREKKILHIIESLGTGGAEKSLVQMVNGLPGFSHTVVVLSHPDNLAASVTGGKVINLNIKSFGGYIRSINRVRRIIREIDADLVHAQLFRSTIVGRLAAGKKVPFVFTLQSMLGEDLFKNSMRSRLLEKLTCSKKNYLIAVSKEALRDYEKYIPAPPNKRIISNSIAKSFFAPSAKDFAPPSKIRLVAVGNLKPLKNFDYIFDALKLLPRENFELDVYGEGSERRHLELRIRNENLPVTLKGNVTNLNEWLGNYDMYLHCSKYEGASLAIFEAMASGLPLVVSDLPVLHENTGGYAVFVSLSDPGDLAKKLSLIKEGKLDIRDNLKKGFEWVKTVAYPDVVFAQTADFYEYIFTDFRQSKKNK